MRYALLFLFSFSLFAQTTPQEWFNAGATRYGSGDYAGALAAFAHHAPQILTRSPLHIRLESKSA